MLKQAHFLLFVALFSTSCARITCVPCFPVLLLKSHLPLVSLILQANFTTTASKKKATDSVLRIHPTTFLSILILPIVHTTAHHIIDHGNIVILILYHINSLAHNECFPVKA